MRALSVGCLLSSCASAGGTCRVAALPLAGQATPEGMAAAAARVRGDCEVIPADRIQEAVPAEIATLDQEAAAALLELLAAGDAAACGTDVPGGMAKLEAGWNRLREHPELLPQDPEARAQVYHALVTFLRIRSRDEPAVADLVGDWLARHMPDQIPSVKLLPPVLAARVSSAAEDASRNAVAVSAAGPAGCDCEARLVLDGRVAAGLPVSGLSVALGPHAVWTECGESRSWIRRVEVGAGAALPDTDLEIEPWVLVQARAVAVDPAAPAEIRPELGRRAAAWLGGDGILLVPTELCDPALLVTAFGVEELPARDGAYVVTSAAFDAPVPWTRTAAWIAFPISAALLGCGLWANAAHDDEIDSMSAGTQDRRAAADQWKTAAIACYAGAGVAFAAAVVFAGMDLLAPAGPVPAPLFSTNSTDSQKH